MHDRAMWKIKAARDEIIQLAARMQAAGTDTSALTPPLVDIQEALADLESPEAASVDPVHDRGFPAPEADDGRANVFIGGPRAERTPPELPPSRQEESIVGLDAHRAGVAANIMGLIAERTRLQILASLAERELTVGELCTRLRCLQPTISHHLALLRQAGMVVGQRDGKRVQYRLGARARRVAAGVIEVEVDAMSVRLSLPILSTGFGVR